jgi:hypothetical protein
MVVAVSLSIVVTWMLSASTLIGIGSLLLRKLDVEYSLFDSFWTGLCISIAITQVYNLFRPIDPIIAASFFAVGVLGIFLNRAVLIPLSRRSSHIGFWPGAVCVASLVIIAVRCSGPVVHYDTGFYGAMAVRWLVTYPLVPGLTNLLGQLGLNSNVFLGVAILNQGPWREAGFHVFVGLLLCALVMRIAASFSQVFYRGSDSLLDYFILLFAIPSTVWALNGELVGTNTDLPTTMVSIAGMIALFDGLQENSYPERAERRIESHLLVSVLLFTLAVTFKISSLALGGIGWVVATFQLWSESSSSKRKQQLVKAAFVLSCSMGIPWICRGLILSGYPFFPSSAFALPVDWTVPRDIADGLAQFNRSWARIPHATLAETAGSQWLRPWFSAAIRNRVDFIIPVLISFAGLAVLLSRKKKESFFALKVLLPAFGGLLFWFALAPAFRFGESSIWITAACMGAIVLQRVLPNIGNVSKLAILLGLLGIGAWCSYPRTLWRANFAPSINLGGFLPLPTVRTIPHVLSPGLEVNVPIDTNQCWGTAIPCSPYFSDQLKLRRGTALRWGFAVTGSSLPASSDKFTPLHRRYIQSYPAGDACSSCHFDSK